MTNMDSPLLIIYNEFFVHPNDGGVAILSSTKATATNIYLFVCFWDFYYCFWPCTSLAVINSPLVVSSPNFILLIQNAVEPPPPLKLMASFRFINRILNSSLPFSNLDDQGQDICTCSSPSTGVLTFRLACSRPIYTTVPLKTSSYPIHRIVRPQSCTTVFGRPLHLTRLDGQEPDLSSGSDLSPRSPVSLAEIIKVRISFYLESSSDRPKVQFLVPH